MSDSLIAFQPAIELPSNMKPSVNMSSLMMPDAMVRCCHLPLGSVKRRSTQSISSSLIRDRIVPGLFDMALALALSLFWSFPRKREPALRARHHVHCVPAFAGMTRGVSRAWEPRFRSERRESGGRRIFHRWDALLCAGGKGLPFSSNGAGGREC